jgi:hypothetical protein
MAIDQRDITSQLRMMDDRALQQYAAMHKSDPYVFPLAFQESQNRQKLRMSGQARMAGQEQPKVADAALMAMTPEAQGISGLPAPNMQHMADGGIAGYDEEQGMATGGMGGMFNFAQQSEPVIRMSGGGVPGYRGPTDGEDPEQVTDEFKGVDDQIAANMERQKMLGAFDDYSKPAPKKVEPKKGSKADKKEEETKKAELPAIVPYVPKTAAEARAEANKIAAPDLAEIQSNYKPFAEQFTQDRERVAGREKNMLSDALIRAGLKTMAGKSQFAMQNIGEGGLEGLNAYQEAEKSNDAARKSINQSEMLMGQARRAEERGARGEANGLFAQAEKAQQAATQFSQHARQLAGTEEFQKEQAAHFKRADAANMLAAQASMARANALGGTSDDKHMAALAKVQNTLNADKEYQEAAKMAKYAGPMGEKARATMDRKKREVYRLLAPELLQSLDAGKTAPPAGSGGGTNLPPIKSFYY